MPIRHKTAAFSVTIEAFDRISTRTVEAVTKSEAEAIALREIGFRVTSKRQPLQEQ